MLKGMLLKCMTASVMLLAASSVQAQEATTGSVKEASMKKGKKGGNKAFMDSLSEDQKAAYKSLKADKKSANEAMKATYSPEQLAIVDNKELDKKAKKEALKATLTDAQKKQKEANKVANKSAKETFEGTLSDEQKALMPKGHGKKGMKGGKKDHTHEGE